MTDLEDLALLKQYRETKKLKYLGHLYDRYIHLVYGLCLKYLQSAEDSKDATMNIFEQLVATTLTTEVQHFKSWLYVVAKNHCLMALRKRKKENIIPLGMESIDIPHLNEETSLEGNLQALERCIEELKSAQRECVQLFYLEKKSYQQITDISGIEMKMVKSAIQNGKRNLKSCLENLDVRP